MTNRKEGNDAGRAEPEEVDSAPVSAVPVADARLEEREGLHQVGMDSASPVQAVVSDSFEALEADCRSEWVMGAVQDDRPMKTATLLGEAVADRLRALVAKERAERDLDVYATTQYQQAAEEVERLEAALAAKDAELAKERTDREWADRKYYAAADASATAHHEVDRLKGVIRDVDAAARTVLELLELGDGRLLASDGPAGGQKPDLDAKEWGRVYRACGVIAARLREEAGK